MKENKTERILAAYRKMTGDGRLPTVSEVAADAGVAASWTANILKAHGLACRTVPRGKSEKRELNQKMNDDAFIRDYQRLTDHYGRPPTLLEISMATGRVTGGGLLATLRRLGLPYSTRRTGRKKAAAQEKRAQGKETGKPKQEEGRRESGPTPEQQFVLHRAVPSIEKILMIKGSGDPEQRPETLLRAGAAYGMTDRIWLDCPVCGRRRLIAPRMHPWWLRNRSGEPIFVCRDTCTGRTV